MELNPPQGVVQWYSHNLVGPRTFASLKWMLTGKKQTGGSPQTSYVKLSDKEANEVIENIKKDPEGFPGFDEENAPDKGEEYQKWIVARYLTKVREDGFEERRKEGVKELEEELGPEGLDELLGLIREEAKVAVASGPSDDGGGGGSIPLGSTPPPPPSSSELAVVPKKPQDLVEDDIDSQILSILGLEDVFDLTYEEYATLLKEAAVKGRMANSQMTTESIELVTEEFKRVKNKTGRFRVKSKKVDINKVLNRRQPTPSGAIVKAQKLIPQGIEEENDTVVSQAENLQKDLIDNIGNILESLITIRSLLKEQDKTEKEDISEERKKSEKEKSKSREKKLESKKDRVPKIFGSITKPVGNFFDAIKNYFKNILIGSVVLAALKWLKNPENKNAIDSFTNFLQNNAGLILGGLLAIAALPLVPTLLSLTGAVIGIAIPALKAAFAFLSTPAGLAALATIAGIGAGIATVKGVVDISRNIVTGGKKFREAQDRAAAKRQSAGVSRRGKVLERRGSRLVEGTKKRSPEQEKAYQEWLKETKRIDDIRDAMRAEIKTEVGKVKPSGIKSTGRTKGQKYFTEEDREKQEKIKQRIREKYEAQLSGASQPSIQPQTPKTSDYVSPFAGARDREALKASKITGNTSISIGERAGYSASRGRVHAGRDIAAPSGTGLQVPSDSVITDKGVDGGYGNYIVFKDVNGIEHLYGHMLEASPYSKGDNVSAGTVIGRVGSTGRSSGPHLHWEVSRVMGEVGRPRQNIIDPLEIGFSSQAPFTGKVEAAKIAQTKPSIPSIPSPTGRSDIIPLPLPIGNTQGQALQSSSAASQTKVPIFPSEDPNNMTTIVVKGIYNVVG